MIANGSHVLRLRYLSIVFLAALPVMLSGQSQSPVRTSTIRGRVTDTGGYVMPGIPMVARPSSGGPLLHTTTVAGGQYEFPDLVSGHFDVFAFLDGFDTSRIIGARVWEPYYELDFRLRLGARLECVVVQEPAYGTVEGIVADEKGFPLPFAVVEVRQLSGTRIYGDRYLDAFGYADSDGRYSANAPAGHIQLSVTYPGCFGRCQEHNHLEFVGISG